MYEDACISSSNFFIKEGFYHCKGQMKYFQKDVEKENCKDVQLDSVCLEYHTYYCSNYKITSLNTHTITCNQWQKIFSIMQDGMS